MRPRVSLLMPVYNAEGTLPWAIGSLLAQTFSDWEAIVVDDGSSDGSAGFVNGVGDKRFRLIQNGRHRGRGCSRQIALEAARGEFVAFLDADDWLFPDRLSLQIAAMEAESGICLVSSGLAIVDDSRNLIGVRGCADRSVGGTMSTLAHAPVAFASSMIRRDPGPRQRFSSDLRYSEDNDFLIRLMLGRRYFVLDEVSYVYAEETSASVPKMIRSHLCSAGTYWSYRREYPARAAKLGLFSLGKAAAWAIAGPSYKKEWLRRRSMPPTQYHRDKYQTALQGVTIYANRLQSLACTDRGNK